MAVLPQAQRARAEAIAQIAYCNPFLPERVELERRILGPAFREGVSDWNARPDVSAAPPNVLRVTDEAERLAEGARARFAAGADASDAERAIYEDLVLCWFYHRHRERIRAADAATPAGERELARLWGDFVAAVERFELCERTGLQERELPHLFAMLMQICRAFHNVFNYIFGVSRPAVRLRAEVWQSVFTHDVRRYRRVLYARMGDYTTLVCGPSGTGKELVARAIGLSSYVPFDRETRKLVREPAGQFHALNLSALSETLIESELFGHARGAFTGAVQDRQGWLELCPSFGTVFLDELGEVGLAIQVKLLRVLEERRFCRVGETTTREFRGKILAATNRDPVAAMREGLLRSDLYYRLCSDMIRMPSLRERLDDDAGERRHLIDHLAQRLVGEEAGDFADEVEAWIDAELGRGYAWPGNIRELEQCMRNILIRHEYRPPERLAPAGGDAYDELAARMRAHELSADGAARAYCSLVHAELGTLEAAARVLELDRRTVRARVGGR